MMKSKDEALDLKTLRTDLVVMRWSYSTVNILSVGSLCLINF